MLCSVNKLITKSTGIAFIIYVGFQSINLASAQSYQDKKPEITPEMRKITKQANQKASKQKSAIEKLVEDAFGRVRDKPSLTTIPTFDKNGKINLDVLIAKNNFLKQSQNQRRSPTLISFVSLSMPPAMLKNIIEETALAKGHVVIRGFVNGDIKQTASILKKLLSKNQDYNGILIDPRLFRTYDIKAVPTFVVTKGDVRDCGTGDPFCAPLPPAFDKISGSIFLEYALERIASEGAEARTMANTHLRILQLHRKNLARNLSRSQQRDVLKVPTNERELP